MTKFMFSALCAAAMVTSVSAQGGKDMLSNGTKEGTPFFCISLIDTDTVTGCKPKVAITVLQYIMNLIVHQ